MATNAFSNDGLSREWRWFVMGHYRARGLGAIMLRQVAWARELGHDGGQSIP
jgi:hypothetical protein